jgi:ATP-dependent RNA helicase DDX5/DBP2
MPTFHLLLTKPKTSKRGPPNILILAPTRELACQIEEECVRFGKSSDIRSTCIYGGVPKSPQIRKIQAGIEVLVATPGRLNDILDVNAIDLSHVEFLGEILCHCISLRTEIDFNADIIMYCY